MWAIFSTIAAHLANIGKGIAFWFTALFQLIFKCFRMGWALRVLVLGLVWIAFKDMGVMIGTVLSHLGTVVGPGGLNLSAPGSAGNWFAVANTFAPLDELFGYLIIYLHLVVGFGVYRLIKSWIPTLSGS